MQFSPQLLTLAPTGSRAINQLLRSVTRTLVIIVNNNEILQLKYETFTFEMDDLMETDVIKSRGVFVGLMTVIQ